MVVDGGGHSWRLADAGGGQSLMVIMVDGGWWGEVVSICSSMVGGHLSS